MSTGGARGRDHGTDQQPTAPDSDQDDPATDAPQSPDSPGNHGADQPQQPAEPTEERHRHHHGDVPVLLDKTDDRWEWRRKIRADPHKARIYRVVIAIAGTLLIALGAVTGPLPGPGGIPLVLLGLAVWASEFEWAQRLMQWFKKQLHKFRGWSRPRQVLGWVIFFACLGALGYGYLLLLGLPTWMPAAIAHWLDRLPGVN
ncbi:PGPGW domain-containing protein [Microlunatus soli]|nr:PGPGW domain-containing protein [Microlunatus soli]